MYSNKPELFIPDDANPEAAFKRTTHLAIAAHQDDIEIMAWHGIAQCFDSEDKWFSGVVLTCGAGSPLNGRYSNLNKGELAALRNEEQKKAAVMGRYGFVSMLGYHSCEVKNALLRKVIDDLADIIAKSRPETIYTHSPFDRHDTHVAVFIKVIQALRKFSDQYKPKNVFGCEVWRSLDWLDNRGRVSLDCARHQDISTEIIRVFDSQISSGKMYDKAVEGRRLANATFDDAYAKDMTTSITYAVDLMPLLEGKDIMEFVSEKLNDFAGDVTGRITKLT